jgi:hypothetical protein
MKKLLKQIVFIVILFSYLNSISINNLFADENNTEITILKNKLEKIENNQYKLKNNIEEIKNDIDNNKNNLKILEKNISKKIENNNIETNKNIESVDSKIQTINSELENNAIKFQNELTQINSNLNNSLKKLESKLTEQRSFFEKNINILQNDYRYSQKYLKFFNSYFLFITFIIFLTILFLFASYFYLKKSFLEIIAQIHKEKNTFKNDLTDELARIRNSFDNEIFMADCKLVELLEQFLIVKKQQEDIINLAQPDHSLILKIADEISRINKNIQNMDSDTKGLKQLVAAVDKVVDSLMANGYEIVDMLNKPYDKGMKAQTTFKSNENLKQNEFLISRIIKPQVNYQGKMIQAAHIEVSFNDSLAEN